MGALTFDIDVVIAFLFKGRGHLTVGLGPAAVLVEQVVGAFLLVDADVLARIGADPFRIDVSAGLLAAAEVSADLGEAADGREDLAEGIGAMPGGVEGADAARRRSGDGTTGRLLGELHTLGFRERDHFLEQELHIEVGDAVVFEGTVRLAEGLALLVLAVGVLRVGHEARCDEEGNRYRHFLLGDQVVEDHRHPPGAGTRGIARAVLEHHQRGFLGGIILCRDVKSPLTTITREGL